MRGMNLSFYHNILFIKELYKFIGGLPTAHPHPSTPQRLRAAEFILSLSKGSGGCLYG